MAVVVVCVLLVLAGLAAVVRWGGLTVQPPLDPAPPPDGPADVSAADAPDDPPPAGLVARRYLWYVNLALASGFGAGLLAAGAGGRLMMRLLAVTAGPGARGGITVFTALFLGLASGVLYLLLPPWLPVGRVGGIVYCALLLVLAGSRLEPLRRENPDFDLVGPGWVSVVGVASLDLIHGMLVAALAARISRSVPLLGTRPAAFAAHAPLLLLAPLVPVAVTVAL